MLNYFNRGNLEKSKERIENTKDKTIVKICQYWKIRFNYEIF